MNLDARGVKRTGEGGLERVVEPVAPVSVTGPAHARLERLSDGEVIVQPLRIRVADVLRDADSPVADRDVELASRVAPNASGEKDTEPERLATVLQAVAAQLRHRLEHGVAELRQLRTVVLERVLHVARRSVYLGLLREGTHGYHHVGVPFSVTWGIRGHIAESGRHKGRGSDGRAAGESNGSTPSSVPIDERAKSHRKDRMWQSGDCREVEHEFGRQLVAERKVGHAPPVRATRDRGKRKEPVHRSKLRTRTTERTDGGGPADSA